MDVKSHCKGRVENWSHFCNLPAHMPRDPCQENYCQMLLKPHFWSWNYPRDPVPRQLQHHVVPFDRGIAKPSFPIISNAGCSLSCVHCLLNGKVTESSLGRWECDEGCERERVLEQTHALWATLSGNNSTWWPHLSNVGPWSLKSISMRCFQCCHSCFAQERCSKRETLLLPMKKDCLPTPIPAVNM